MVIPMRKWNSIILENNLPHWKEVEATEFSEFLED